MCGGGAGVELGTLWMISKCSTTESSPSFPVAFAGMKKCFLLKKLPSPSQSSAENLWSPPATTLLPQGLPGHWLLALLVLSPEMFHKQFNPIMSTKGFTKAFHKGERISSYYVARADLMEDPPGCHITGMPQFCYYLFVCFFKIGSLCVAALAVFELTL